MVNMPQEIKPKYLFRSQLSLDFLYCHQIFQIVKNITKNDDPLLLIKDLALNYLQ